MVRHLHTAARKAKIACSLDAALLARVEHIRLGTGESRSALIDDALRFALGLEDG